MLDWRSFPLPPEAPVRGTCVRVERPEPGLVVLTLDPPHRERTVLDVPLWRDLSIALDAINPDADDRGLVLRGRDPLHFAYGADLDAIEGIEDPSIVKRLTEHVHSVLNRLEDLSRKGMTTVAAVGGPVPGGALELSLACRYVLAADHPSTRLGLPETKLGILPGWGGSHRLPRKIGVPAALTAILTGRLYDVRRASRLGIVDRKTPPEYLDRIANDLAMGRTKARTKKRGILGWLVDRNPLVTALIERRATSESRAKTRGKYPAIETVIPIVVDAPRTGRAAAAAKEADAVSRLATSPECKALVSIFRGSEEAKKSALDDDGNRPAPITHGSVVGAGVMGGAIASLLAERGVETRLADLSAEALDSAGVAHQREIESKRRKRRLQSHEANSALDRFVTTRDLVGLDRSQVVVEAVAERLDVKRAVLTDIARKVSSEALLATNTSSLSVTEIAEGLPNPERVVGLHFFNPVRRMPLVEIIPGERTSEECVRRAAALALALGKTPVVVKDVSGFLVNRVLGPYLDEALRLLEGGVSPGRLEELLLDFGMPMGPLRLLDEVGFDIAAHAARSLHEAYGERMTPSQLLEPCIEEGRLGRKSGFGFYDWSHGGKGKESFHMAGDLTRFREGEELDLLSDADIVDRCVLAMVNEAARCLEEGVVRNAAELDLATVFGMGFAPFRGGLASYANSVGALELVRKLEAIAECEDIRERPGGRAKFEPARMLQNLARDGGRWSSVRSTDTKTPKKSAG